MRKKMSLSYLLKNHTKNSSLKIQLDEQVMKQLQLKLLRIQQGVFHKKDRVVIVFEGFDAAGKGGAIRKITEVLDPRGFRVIPIGAPTNDEQGTHWLYRFWKELPKPGQITIFDRSWYGRVLVEKVEKLTSEKRIKDAYREINEFEAQLVNDGIILIKFFLAISKDTQYQRFQDRLNDPYKQWKITIDDVRSRERWNDYVDAVDELLKKNHTDLAPWNLIPANDKKFARLQILHILTNELQKWEKWMEKKALSYEKSKLTKLLKR
jgi:polyphosphate kinase 2 (PPK2 family)